MASIVARLAALLSPQPCAVCGNRLGADDGAICPACSMALPRTMYWETPEDNPMARLFWGIVPVERCAAWYFFTAGSQAAYPIYGAKYRSRPEDGYHMGKAMAEEMAPGGFFQGIGAIVPMPLSKGKERQRGYNQSLWIARGVAEATGIAVEQKAAERVSYSGSQTSKDRWRRAENVEGAFRLRSPGRIGGKHVLVVDDVVTTGATAGALIKELVKAPGVKVSILAIGFAKK